MIRHPLAMIKVIPVLLMFLAIPLSETGGSMPHDRAILTDSDLRTTVIGIDTMISVLDGTDPLDLSVQRIVMAGDQLDMGITGGDDFEIIYDPTPGEPMIPLLATVIRIPGEVRDVRITTGDHRSVLLRDPIPLMPRATSPWEEEDERTTLTTTPDDPDRISFSRIGYSHIDGVVHSVYSVWIRVLHITSPASLSHGGETEVTIEWEEVEPEPAPMRSEGDPENVPGTLSVTPYMELHPDYLIITSEDLSDELSRLADWRNDMGIPTSVVTVDDIKAEYRGSEDPADLIREYIREVYVGWDDLEYVLLAGDWDKVPTKRVIDSDAYPGWDDGYIPADSYYQCLDGTWDSDGDGIYGEIGDLEDIIPDLAVSRLAINDPEIWSDKIDQIIMYDLGLEGVTWSSEAVLIGANTHNEGDGSNHSDYLWEKYIEDAYSVKVPLYEDDGSLSKSSIDTSLMDGAGFVNFIDHGGPNEWCDDYGRSVVYRSRDARALTNAENLPVISTLACLTTWFDDTSGSSYSFTECLGEAFTENTEGGGIGYVGSSRTSVGILGARKYLPYDNGLQEDFIRQISLVREFSLGPTYTGAKQHYAEVWGNQFAKTGNPEVSLCWLEYTLLGETAVNLWTAPSGEFDVEVYHEDDLDPHIFIAVKDSSGEPVPYANVTLVNFKRKVFETAMTDLNGEIAFDITLDWFCDINLSVWKHNFNPYIGHIRISDVIPPETLLMTDPIEPDGENKWFRTDPSVSLMPNEEAAVHYRIGMGGYLSLNGSGNYTIPALGEGFHQIHFFAEDIAGNREEERHRDVKIDLTDPGCRILISPGEPDGENGWYTTDPLITLESEENDMGSPVSFQYWIDERDERPYEGPFFLSEGQYQLRARATDGSGRRSNVSWINISVDTAPPSTHCSLNPNSPDGEDGWYTRTPTMILTSDEEDSRMEYRFSPKDYFQPYSESLKLPDGEYDIQFRSRDPAGNIDDTGSMTVRIDSSEPDVTYTIFPDEPDGDDGYYITTPTLRMSWDDNIGASLWQRIDYGEVTRSTSLIKVEDGEHVIEFYAVDMAGHQSDKVKLTFKVDTVDPETSVNLMGSRRGEWFVSSPTISLETTELCYTYYSFDSGELMEYEIPFETPDPEGIFNLRFRSVDRAGNVEETGSYRIKVDSEEPDISAFISDRSEGRIVLDLAGTTDGFDDLEYRVSSGESVLIDWTYDPIVGLDLPAGRHRLTIEARDPAGNVASDTLSVVVEDSRDYTYYYAALIGGTVAILAVIIFFMIGKGRRPVYPDDHHYEEIYDGDYHQGSYPPDHGRMEQNDGFR